MGRHDHFHEVLGDTVAALTFHKHFVDVAIIEVADRTFDEVTFLVNLRRCDGFEGQFTDLLPHALQVFIVALDLGFGTLSTRRAHNEASALWHFDLLRDLFELLAVRCVCDLAGNTATACSVGHQHAIATSKRQVRSEGSTFVAALFLNDLNQQDLTDFNNFLNLVTARTWFAHGTDVFAVVFIGDRFDIVVFLGSRRFVALFVITVRFFGCLDGCFFYALHR